MVKKGRQSANHNMLLALACGATIENAARQAGVCEMTVYRRLKDPEFKAQLQAIRNDMVERTAAMLTAAALEAVKKLLKLQGDGNPHATQLGAAKAILDYGVKLRENSEILNRIAALEVQVTGAA